MSHPHLQLKLVQIKNAVIAGDYEWAHLAEDELREAILWEIAAGSPDARELAAIALSTGRVEFERWYT